ncbi:MAG: DUF2076 domain-containing protein [Pseudolabrys sp.]|nr:DUF2076 domain-containing protein [Pseudolabrys sp.]
MTPQERQLVDELFDKLARLENAPRDPAAERAIAEGLQQAPHAIYPLVQTVLVQDEALKRAEARIRELSGEEPQQQGGFLDSMRNMFLGGRGSVPSVPANDPRYGGQQSPIGGGGSFLGTAAASAVGVIGGAMLMNSLSSMFGNRGHAASAFDSQQGSPWGDEANRGPFDDSKTNYESADNAGGFNVADSGDFDTDFGSDSGGDFGSSDA